MKIFFKMTCSILLLIIVSPCLSQGFHYDGPEDDKLFFIIGWSKDGKRLAYGMYKSDYNPIMEKRICKNSVIIQDLVMDSIIWVNAKDWSSSNSDFPESARQAWVYFNILFNVNEELWRHGIEVPSHDAIIDIVSGNIMPVKNDSLTVDIKVFENDNGCSKKYEVHVISKNL